MKSSELQLSLAVVFLEIRKSLEIKGYLTSPDWPHMGISETGINSWSIVYWRVSLSQDSVDLMLQTSTV